MSLPIVDGQGRAIAAPDCSVRRARRPKRTQVGPRGHGRSWRGGTDADRADGGATALGARNVAVSERSAEAISSAAPGQRIARQQVLHSWRLTSRSLKKTAS